MSFASETSPKMADLELRLSAVEAATQLLIDGTWTQFTPGMVGGVPGFSVDLQPSVVQFMTLAKASAVPLTPGTAANVTQLSLGPFRWLVFGVVGYTARTPINQPQVNNMVQASSATSATLPTVVSSVPKFGALGTNTVDPRNLIMPALFDFTAAAGNSDLYLVAQAAFDTGAALGIDAYGTLMALRVA